MKTERDGDAVTIPERDCSLAVGDTDPDGPTEMLAESVGVPELVSAATDAEKHSVLVLLETREFDGTAELLLERDA